MPMLEQHEVAGYLLRRRLISRRCIVAGSLRIADASSRNRNFRVTGGAPGESYLLKQGIVADSAHTLANEAALYRRLSAGGAALRRCVPRLHRYDAAGALLILEWIEDGVDLERHVAARGGCGPALAAALGRALATLHAVGRDEEALRDDPPWVLALHRPPLEALRYLSAGSIELVRRLQADDALCGAFDALRTGWRADVLVHRDVKWANWIAHAPAGGGRLTQVKLVDWEMAGWGDPAFDVGSALSDFASLGLDAAPTPVAARSGSAAFWRAYVRAAGLDAPAAAALLERSVRFAGARLVQSAFEHTQETTAMSARVGRLVALARELLVAPDGRAAGELLVAGA